MSSWPGEPKMPMPWATVPTFCCQSPRSWSFACAACCACCGLLLLLVGGELCSVAGVTSATTLAVLALGEGLPRVLVVDLDQLLLAALGGFAFDLMSAASSGGS